MYKAKLQETCQRRRWALPRYATVKEGAEHCPSFSASVYVNGLSFRSPSSSAARSAKEAQNLAARLAFLHLSPPPIEAEEQTEEQKSKTKEESEGQDAKAKASKFQSQYKIQLQNYARWKNLDPPVYTVTKDGLAHALRFKAVIWIGGSTFESHGFSRTSEEAECAAAKAALESLSADRLQEEHYGFYKMELMELARYEDLRTPVYSTIKCGLAHRPIFFSSVEVAGEMFYGKAGKTKKQAESKAARAAYIILNERFKNRSGLKIFSEHQESLNKESQLVEHLESRKGGEDESEISADAASTNATAILEHSSSSSPTAVLDSCSSEPTHEEISTPPAVSAASNSYLLGNRFRIYTYFPSDIAFPKSIKVLPVGDNKWIAANLELLN